MHDRGENTIIFDMDIKNLEGLNEEHRVDSGEVFDFVEPIASVQPQLKQRHASLDVDHLDKIAAKNSEKSTINSTKWIVKLFKGLISAKFSFTFFIYTYISGFCCRNPLVSKDPCYSCKISVTLLYSDWLAENKEDLAFEHLSAEQLALILWVFYGKVNPLNPLPNSEVGTYSRSSLIDIWAGLN